MNISEPNSNYYEEDEISLDANVLITTTATTSSPGKYRRIWRRYLLVRVIISLHVSDRPSDEQQNAIIKFVKERNLHSLKRFGGVQRVASHLRSDLKTGINGDHHSRSKITKPLRLNGKGFFCNLLEAFNPFSIYLLLTLLLISAGLSFAIEIKEQGTQYGWHDGVAILVAVLLIVTFCSVTNFLRQRKLERQHLEKGKSQVEVVRNGETQFTTVSDLVVGDLVLLKEDDTVPADGLFVDGECGNTLVLDEVLNSKIDCDDNPFLLSGSKVTTGQGNMILVGSGAASDDPIPKERNFLEARIEKANSHADNLSFIISVLIALAVLIRLLSKRQHGNDDILPELKGNTKVDVLMKIFETMFWRPRRPIFILTGILTSTVIGLQHGTSLAITIFLSYWNWKVELSGVKPQNLSACGTLGHATIICIDATGGLFCKEMEAVELHVGGEEMHSNDAACESETSPFFQEALRQVICAYSLVPDDSVRQRNGVLAAWARSSLGVNMELLDQCFCVLDHGRLRSNRNCSRVVIKNNRDDGQEVLHLHLTGDASEILKLCSRYYDTNGINHAIEDQKSNFEQVVKNMKNRGLTAIAFASKQIETLDSGEEDSNLLALVGLNLKCPEALIALRNAGVRIKLASRDKLLEVRDIAHQLGIIQPKRSDDVELEGKQIRDLTDLERKNKIDEAIVIGSCLSEDMLFIVKSLNQSGHVVAFFGGLTTADIPTLNEADVGISKENQSTAMARESSDIVLPAESSLASLPQVMKYGRCAYKNIQKFTQLQLTAFISGLVINLVAAICSWDSPLTPIQLMWVNFVTCLLGGLMMVMELMANRPSNPTEPLLDKAAWKNIATQVLTQTCLLLILHIVGQYILSINEDTWKALVFNSFMLCHVLNQFKIMEIQSKEVAKAVVHHYYWFLLALGTVIVMQGVIVEFAESLAGCDRLKLVEWAISFTIAALSLLLDVAIGHICDFLSGCDSNCFGSSGRTRPWTLVSFLGFFPLCMISLISFTYFFYPNDAQAFL